MSDVLLNSPSISSNQGSKSDIAAKILIAVIGKQWILPYMTGISQ
jgi:hypothetical protein